MKNQKGITLIALIITIIVMLILVAVTVRVSVDSGLFGHTKNATSQWKAEEDKELNLGNDNYINNTVNKYSGNNKPDRSFLKVGDYVAYAPDSAPNYTGLGTSTTESENPSGSTDNSTDGIPQDTTLQWRIMSINEDGTVDLISAKPTNATVYFQGSLGYNNGVYLLNDLCKTQYSNTSLGATARSINLLDIESNFNSEGIAARNAFVSDGSVQYGGTKVYTGSSANTPDIYKHVGKTAVEEVKDYYPVPTKETHTQEESLEMQQTYYYFSNTPASYFDDSAFHELIFGTGTYYWLASRYAYCFTDVAHFGLRNVYSVSLYGYVVFDSDAYATNNNLFVRPVVTLGANIQISATGGTADNPRTLSK